MRTEKRRFCWHLTLEDRIDIKACTSTLAMESPKSRDAARSRCSLCSHHLQYSVVPEH